MYKCIKVRGLLISEQLRLIIPNIDRDTFLIVMTCELNLSLEAKVISKNINREQTKKINVY